MRGFRSVRRRRLPATRSSAVIVAGVLLLTALVAPATMAAAPNPSQGSAIVDGNIDDWSLGDDFFADMTDAGIADRPVRAKLFLRYDCDSNTLFALVLAQGNDKAQQTRPENAYVRIDGTGKLISGGEPANGEFEWVSGDGTLADGWEGGNELAPGSYSLRAHVLIDDDSTDGYAPMDPIGREVPLVIECQDVEPTPTPTPTPVDPTPTPDDDVDPTDPPVDGGVLPTTRTNPQATLPPTDTIDQATTAQPASVGMVLLLLGVTSMATLVVTARRRRPIVATAEEPTER